MSSLTQKYDLTQSEDFIPGGDCKDNFATFFFGGVRRSAVIETVAFFSAALLLNSFFGDGTRFISMTPHPFWVIILLVIVQYGQREAIFAALVASAFLLVGNMPEQSLSETMYDYYFRVFFQPLLWVMMALLLGSVRSRQLHEREDLIERLSKNEESTHQIATSYVDLKRTKEQLELRLAEERRSVLTVYQMAKAIHTATDETLMKSIGRLVTVALNPKKFSIFWCEGNAFVLAQSFGWNKDDAFARRFGKNAPLISSIVKTRQALSITIEGQEKLLGVEGMLAGPIYEEKTGKLLGILKIEETGFIDMVVNAPETFGVVCKWISLACSCAEQHREFQLDEIRMPSKNLFHSGKAPSTIEIPLTNFYREMPSELS